MSSTGHTIRTQGSLPTLRLQQKLGRTVCLLLMVSIRSVADAEIYQWVDKQGNIHITDNSTNIPDAQKENIKVVRDGENRAAANDDRNMVLPKAEPKNSSQQFSRIEERLEENKIDKHALESELQFKWNSMKRELVAGNIEAALKYYAEFSRPAFRAQFMAIRQKLAEYVATMGEMRLVNVREYYAECDLRTVKEGTEYSFQVLFIRERDGIWRIMSY